MFKQKYVLEVKGREDRIHRYMCDPETSHAEAFDALTTMRAFVLEAINKAVEKEKAEMEAKSEQKEEKIEEGEIDGDTSKV